MDAATLKTIYPSLTDEDVAAVTAIYQAAAPLQSKIAEHLDWNTDMRRQQAHMISVVVANIINVGVISRPKESA